MSDTLWSIICVAGLWGFVACTILLILKAFPARDSFDRSAALKWGAGVLICFLAWVVGMTQA